MAPDQYSLQRSIRHLKWLLAVQLLMTTILAWLYLSPFFG